MLLSQIFTDHNKTIQQVDPAILLCGPPSTTTTTTFKYTHQELILLRNAPISKQRPIFMDDPIFISRGYWKRSESPYDERTERVNRCIATGTVNSTINSTELKRRSGVDPRERLRKEDNNIVLSPQRRSFNMGCQMPSIPSNLVTGISRIDRETNRGRIGSGRILNRDVSWDYKPPEKDPIDAEFNFRSQNSMREQRPNNSTSTIVQSQDERNDRRSYGRDDTKSPLTGFQQPQTHQRNSRNLRYSNGNGMNSYERHGRRYNDRDEEPEWFSGGPTSQHDVIELRGFEDPIDDEPAPQPVKTIKNKTKIVKPTTVTKIDETEMKINEEDERSASPLQQQLNDTNNNDSKNQKKKSSDDDFNFEDFLNLNSLNEIFDDEQSGPCADVVSRFSRWFRPDSPTKQKLVGNSRRSSLHDELYNIINDGSPNQQNETGNDSNKYFAPISPANSTNTLLEFLHRGKFPTNDKQQEKIRAYTDDKQQIHSVEELEAKMRQTAPNQRITQNPENSKQQEAFKKLLAQMSDEQQQNNSVVIKNEEIQKVGPLMFSGHQHSLRQQHQRHQGQAPIQLLPPTPPTQQIPQQQHQNNVSNILKRPEAHSLMQSKFFFSFFVFTIFF